MATMFDADILDTLRTTGEVGIRTSANANRPVVIWVVVAGDAVFVRSVRGPRGRWNVAARTDGQAALVIGGREFPVHATPTTDAATIEAVSQAFLSKYATSPYAPSMVAPDTLPTTLRLDPA